MTQFPEEQAKRLEAEALEVLRLIVQQTERGENLDANLVDRAKAIIAGYDQAMMRGREGPRVVSFRKDELK